MASGYGIITGHMVTLRRFVLTFWRDIRTGKGLHRRGGGHQKLDFWFGPKERGKQPTIVQDSKQAGIFTVEYPDERLPVYERFRVLPVLIYDNACAGAQAYILLASEFIRRRRNATVEATHEPAS